jgi:hypothetical protein
MKPLLSTCILCLLIMHSFSQDADHKINLDELNFLPGKWNVESSQRLSAQGPWEESKASSTITKTLNSTLIEEEFTGTRTGKPFFIKTLFGINNANNKFQRVFADSEHGVLIVFEGEKNKDTLYFDRTWVYTNGSTVKLRVAYYIISKNEFHMESMRMPQQSTEWDVTGRTKYTRRE